MTLRRFTADTSARHTLPLFFNLLFISDKSNLFPCTFSTEERHLWKEQKNLENEEKKTDECIVRQQTMNCKKHTENVLKSHKQAQKVHR